VSSRDAKKRPLPSFNEGKVHDPKVAEMQDEGFRRDDFLSIVKRAATKRDNADARSLRPHEKATQA